MSFVCPRPAFCNQHDQIGLCTEKVAHKLLLGLTSQVKINGRDGLALPRWFGLTKNTSQKDPFGSLQIL